MQHGPGHHLSADFIPLSAGVLRTCLIGWRLESSGGSSGLNQSPIETCHLKLIDTTGFDWPIGAPFIICIPGSIWFVSLMGGILQLVLETEN